MKGRKKLSLTEKIITIVIVIIGTMITRFLPFLLFRDAEKTPKSITYLGYVLPPAIFGMLVVYSLKDIKLTRSHLFGMPELISIIVIIILHTWKRNMFISMIGGTVLYIILIQLI